jgi:hypothetical protein
MKLTHLKLMPWAFAILACNSDARSLNSAGDSADASLIQGEYLGILEGESDSLGLQVVSLGNGQFKAALFPG